MTEQMTGEQKAEYIESRLTDKDVEAWHKGDITDHVEQLMRDTLDDDEYIAIWGSREGPEPLKVVLNW